MPTERNPMPIGTATFAAGCFWGVEAEFRALPGVTRTTVGYTGGRAEDPTYKQVCRGRTGHAEAVEVRYDPSAISYDELLAAFWSSHNPTSRNRQGWDIGSQYRSAIFFHDDEQRATALASRDAQQRSAKREIVTEIAPADRFWPAEDYHQQYLEKRGHASCAVSLDAA
jgi:peptide-methionine (S)-S-oxide reductase